MTSETKKRLYNELYESISRSLDEVMKKSKSAIYTIGAIDITSDEGYESMPYTSNTYYDEDEAIEQAIQFAKEISDEDDVICISVYGGEYEDKNGNIMGEPYDIFTVSNKPKEITIKARKEAGYVSGEIDAYTEI